MQKLWISVVCSVVLLPSLAHAAGQVPPDELTVNVGDIDQDGNEETVMLQKRSIRSEKYVIGTVDDKGFHKIEPFPVATYRGYVKDKPVIRVNANLEPGGLLSGTSSDGRDLRHGDFNELKINPGTGAGTALMSAGNTVVPLQQTRVSPTPGGYLVPPQPMRRLDLAVEINKSYVDELGGDMEKVVAQVEQRINDADFVYARDIGVAWEVTAVVINLGAKDVPWKEIGEIDGGRSFILHAYFSGSAGTPWSGRGALFVRPFTPLNAARANVRRASGLVHECGHKFGGVHQLDVFDAMNGSLSEIGPANIQGMLRHRETGPEAIFPAVIYNGVLPPLAMDDFGNTTRDTPVTIAVLDNDYDGNGDALLLRSAGPESARGGSVALSDDRRTVRYTPPQGFVGVDRFSYAVVDSAGIPSRTGRVKVDVRTDGLASYFPLDDMENDKYPDLGPYGANGVPYFSDFEYKPLYRGARIDVQNILCKGVRGNALFNPTPNAKIAVSFPGVGDPGRASLSVSLWVLYPENVANRGGSVIICKGGSIDGRYVGGVGGWVIGQLGTAGFKFAGNVARNVAAESFDLRWDSPVLSNTWYHLVMVMDREKKKLRAWVNNQEVLKSDGRSDIPDGVIDCYAPVLLFNSFGWKRQFSHAAVVDEVRIYTAALTPKQVAELYAEGKDAKAPEVRTVASP